MFLGVRSRCQILDHFARAIKYTGAVFSAEEPRSGSRVRDRGVFLVVLASVLVIDRRVQTVSFLINLKNRRSCLIDENPHRSKSENSPGWLFYAVPAEAVVSDMEDRSEISIIDGSRVLQATVRTRDRAKLKLSLIYCSQTVGVFLRRGNNDRVIRHLYYTTLHNTSVGSS